MPLRQNLPGEFPEGVSAPVQYGPRIKAAVVHLTHHHMMPVARTGTLMGDFFCLPMSDATVLAASEEAKTRLAATVAAGHRQRTASGAGRPRRMKPGYVWRASSTGCTSWPAPH